jgi:hypothetical protein
MRRPARSAGEGEGDDEAWPAYVAAVRAALAHKEDKNMLDVALLVASSPALVPASRSNRPMSRDKMGSWGCR